MQKILIFIALTILMASCSFSGLFNPNKVERREQDMVERMSVEEFLKNPIAVRKFDRIGNCYVRPSSSQLWCGIYSISKDENFRNAKSCRDLRGLRQQMTVAAQEGHCH